LSPEAWADAALELIAEQGLEALNVESLARHLGVTKGSFYWHFSSRSALLQVALARWERHDAEVLRKDLDGVPGARARLRRLLWRGGDRVLARLAPSADIPVVRTLERLRGRRTALMAAEYRALGFADDLAERWALLAYSAYAGLDHLSPEDADRAVELLLPGA